MECKLDTFNIYSTLAVCLMALAVALASNWPTAAPLFGAATAIALLCSIVIPKMRQALFDYVACRGPSIKCTLGTTLNKIAQITALLSGISFALAGVLQVAALALLYSFVLSWLGVAAEVAVAALVSAGIIACGAALTLLIIAQGYVYAFKRCMDDQDSNVGGADSPSPGG